MRHISSDVCVTDLIALDVRTAEEMALRFEALGGNKSELAQIVNDAKAEEPAEAAVNVSA